MDKKIRQKCCVDLLDLTYSVSLSSTELETDSSSDKEVSESSCQH